MITEADFKTIMANTSHGPKMRRALRLVLVKGAKQAKAAKAAGVHRQEVYRARLRLIATHPRLIESPC